MITQSTTKKIKKNKILLILATALTLSLTCLWLLLAQKGLFAKEVIYTEGLVGQPNSHATLFDKLLFSSLYDITEELEIENEGRDYIFKIKRAYWNTGEPIEVKEIINNLERAPEFSQLKKTIVDEKTIKISLNQPFAPLEQLTKRLHIYPENYGGFLLDKKFSGRYQITEIIKEENRITQLNLECTQNNRCWKPKLQFRFYPNQTDAFTAAELGEITAFTGQYNLQNWVKIKSPIRGRYYAIFFNLRNEQLQDSNLRKDLAQKTPYTKIVTEIKNQEATTVESPLDYTWADNDGTQPYQQYNKDLRKNYNVTLRLAVCDDREHHLQIAEILKDEWADLGVHVNIEPFNLNNLAEDILKPHNYHLLLIGHEVGTDPDRYAWWHSTQSEFPGLNFSGYENMRADRALEEGRKVIEKEQRIKHYQNFETVLLEDNPAIFLYHPVFTLNVKEGTPIPDLSNLWLLEDRLTN